MWKPTDVFREFEDRLVAESKPDFARNLQMIEAMYQHAVLLGAFPPKDPWDGFEVKVRMAKVLNSVPRTPGEDRISPG
jgi:hypothetical protein